MTHKYRTKLYKYIKSINLWAYCNNKYSLAYHVFVDVMRYNSYVYNGRALFNNLSYILIFQADHMDRVHFQKLVIRQDTITSCRRVLYQTNYLTILELEAHMTKGILVQSYSSLKRPEIITQLTIPQN